LGRAALTTEKDEKMAYPTFVIPVKTGIQLGRATSIAAKDWIPDRAADRL
jgi:hypothetical protein